MTKNNMRHALIKAYGLLWRYTPRNTEVSEIRLKLKEQLTKEEIKQGIRYALNECGDIKASEILTY